MALRITGSVIGEPITSSSTSATGMWTSQEVAALQQDGIWQIAPSSVKSAFAANDIVFELFCITKLPVNVTFAESLA